MNSTKFDIGIEYSIEDYYMVGILSVSFSLIGGIISLMLIMLIYRTKDRLHRIQHLLICNTCIASIIYSVVTINHYLYLIFIRWETSLISCRFRAYFGYIGIAGEIYSYFVQALSRLFYSRFSTKYRWLITYKTHSILIIVQWLFVFVITLSSLLTNDILYNPTKFCLIPVKKTLHVILVIFVYYVLPLFLTILIYFYIYYRVKRRNQNGRIKIVTINGHERDLELLRNIILLITIYLGGGLPTIIFFLNPTKYPFLINLVTQSLTVAIAKFSIIILDKQIRQVIQNQIYGTTRVLPFNNTFTTHTFRFNHQTTF